MLEREPMSLSEKNLACYKHEVSGSVWILCEIKFIEQMIKEKNTLGYKLNYEKF